MRRWRKSLCNYWIFRFLMYFRKSMKRKRQKKLATVI